MNPDKVSRLRRSMLKGRPTAGDSVYRFESCDQRRGFTLLELLIAIGLMSILIAALFSAMNIYVDLRIDGHEEITRQQIARTLLRQMTRDIESLVFKKQETVEDESSSGSSSSGSGGSASSGSGSTGSGSTGTGSTGTGSIGTGSTGTGSSGTGSTGTGSSGTGGSGTGSTGTGSTGTGSTATSSSSSGATSTATDSAMTTYTNGLVGTSDDLLLYVSRPDKDLSYVAAQSLTSLKERSSDMMIVRYLVADTGASGLSGEVADRFANGQDGPVGLIRITGDMFGLSTAIETGKDEDEPLVDSVLAPEVSRITFRYFDGVEWMENWDSTQLNRMPTAIEIVLTLRNSRPAGRELDEDENPFALGDSTHRMVVPVPVAEPFVAESAL